MLNHKNIIETIEMIDKQHLDIRTITMGISLRDCAHPDIKISCQKVYDKICRLAQNLVLAVPSSGFGYPGYIRLSFAVEDAVIERSAEGFRKALKG